MLVKMPEYYRRFKCIAGKCYDSCCDGWKIKIDEKTAEIYRSHKGVLSEKFEKFLTDGNYFILDGSRCPFLNNENTCDIFIHMGEENLSNVCSFYPRRIQTCGNVMYAAMNLSCPEVMRLVLEEREGIKYITYDDGKDAIKESDGPDILLIEETFRRIINDRRFSLKKRMMMCIFIADNLSENRDTSVLSGYNDDMGVLELAQALPDESRMNNQDVQDEMLKELLIIYSDICLTRKHDSLTIELMREYKENGLNIPYINEEKYAPYTYQYENFITGCMFRYITECNNIEDIFKIMVRICVGYAIVRAVDAMCLKKYGNINTEQQIEIMHYYCKITEHSETDNHKIQSVIFDGGYDDMVHMMVLL